jgi:hypothetical protein
MLPDTYASDNALSFTYITLLLENILQGYHWPYFTEQGAEAQRKYVCYLMSPINKQWRQELNPHQPDLIPVGKVQVLPGRASSLCKEGTEGMTNSEESVARWRMVCRELENTRNSN